MGSDIRAGRAFVEVYADDSKLRRGLANASRQLKQFGEDVSSLGTKFMALGAGIVSPLLAATKQFMSIGSQLVDMSARTGMTTNALSELGYAAGQTGAGIEEVEKSVRKMQKTIAEAATGGKAYVDALRAVGLKYSDLRGKSPEDQFMAIAEGINKIKDPTMKAAAAVEIFGRSGTMLVPMLSDIKELRAEAVRLGLSMGKEQAEAADALGDAWDRLVASAKSISVAIGSALADNLTKTTNDIVAGIASIRKWINANGELLNTILKLGAAAVGIGASLFALGKAYTILAASINAAKIAMAAFSAHPVVAATAIASVVALGLAWRAAKQEKDRYEGNVQTGKALGAPVKAFEKGLQGGNLTDTGKAVADMQKNRDRAAAELKTMRDAAAEYDTEWAAYYSMSGRRPKAGFLKLKRPSDTAIGDKELEFKQADLLLNRYKEMRNANALQLGTREGLASLVNKSANGIQAGKNTALNILAGMKSVFAGAKSKAGVLSPLMDAIKGGLKNLPLQEELMRLNAEAIANPQKRDEVLANLEYDKKAMDAGLSGQSVALVEEARQKTIAAIRERYAKEMKDKEEDIAYQTAEAKIMATKEGIEQEKALLELRQRKEKEDAVKAGMDPALLEQKFSYERMALEGKSATRAFGTFSASQAAEYGATGRDRAVKAAEKQLAKQNDLCRISEKMLDELKRMNMEMAI